MQLEPTIGWDLGGAHVKAARLDGKGRVEKLIQLPSPLWQGLSYLEHAIDSASDALSGPADMHAVTMTGELVDLFSDRCAGVATLVELMCRRFPDSELKFFAGQTGFLDGKSASRACRRVASANWLATALVAAQQLPTGLLLDVGSTTSDLIPLNGGRVVTSGMDDHERMRCQELLYTGVVRTPLMAITTHAPFAGEWVPLMMEHFATTADIYRLTGDLPERADLFPAADQGAKDMTGSARRVARMLGLDLDAADIGAWRKLACFMAEQQMRKLADACDRVLSLGLLPDQAPLIGAGVGAFLVERLSLRLERPFIPFDNLFSNLAGSEGARITDCAPAVAVALLAQQQVNP